MLYAKPSSLGDASNFQGASSAGSFADSERRLRKTAAAAAADSEGFRSGLLGGLLSKGLTVGVGASAAACGC